MSNTGIKQPKHPELTVDFSPHGRNANIFLYLGIISQVLNKANIKTDELFQEIQNATSYKRACEVFEEWVNVTWE